MDSVKCGIWDQPAGPKGSEIITLKYCILLIFILFFIGLFSGCKSETSKFKKENLKLQQENLKLQQESLKLQQDKFTLQKVNAELTKQIEFVTKELEVKIEKKIKKTKEQRMKGSLGVLRAAVVIYYGDTGGELPSSLEGLVPKYIDRIPEGDWGYNSEDGKVILKSHPKW